MWGGDCIKKTLLSNEGKIIAHTGNSYSTCGIIGCKVCSISGDTCIDCKSDLYLNTFSDNEIGCYAGCIVDGAQWDPLIKECSRCYGITHCKIDYFSC